MAQVSAQSTITVNGFTSTYPGSTGTLALTSQIPSLPISAANGGTGQTTYTIGDILQASSTTALAKLAAVAANNVLLSGGIGAVSSWGKVTSSHISAMSSSALDGLINDNTGSGGLAVFNDLPTIRRPQLTGATMDDSTADHFYLISPGVKLRNISNDNILFDFLLTGLTNGEVLTLELGATVSGYTGGATTANRLISSSGNSSDTEMQIQACGILLDSINGGLIYMNGAMVAPYGSNSISGVYVDNLYANQSMTYFVYDNFYGMVDNGEDGDMFIVGGFGQQFSPSRTYLYYSIDQVAVAAGGSNLLELTLAERNVDPAYTNGQPKLWVMRIGGIFVGSANAKQIKVYLAGEEIYDSGAVINVSDVHWELEIKFYSKSNNPDNKCVTTLVCSDPAAAFNRVQIKQSSVPLGSSYAFVLEGITATAGDILMECYAGYNQ